MIADRFVVLSDRRVLDLASGEAVVLITRGACSIAELNQWTVRCDGLASLRHREMATLVDYGQFGGAQRFEAWRSGGPWTGAKIAAQRARDRCESFLRSNGVAVGGGFTIARSWDGRPVVIPDARSGSPANDAPAPEAREAALAIESCGMAVLGRSQLTAVAELFADQCRATLRAVALWGPPGSGLETAIAQLARAARLNGFVPVDVRLVSHLRPLLSGRTLCLIDRSGGAGGWRDAADAVLRSARPHVVLFTGRTEVPHVPGIGLERLSVDALIESVRPRMLPPALRRRVHQAARKANGWPGTFGDLLWGPRPSANAAGRSMPLKVAEQPAPYAAPTGGGPARLTPESSAWAANGELTGLRERLDAAITLIDSGRQAAGMRTLRQATGALGRRRDWGGAGRGALALAAVLLKRGRPREAQAVLEDYREHVRAAAEEPLLLDAAVLSGRAWTDLARLDEAEHVLRAAVAMASGAPDEARVRAGLALARCLFWHGRYDEAAEVIGSRAIAWDHPLQPALAAAATCVAVGRRDVAGAVARARDALQAAERSSDPAVTSIAAYAAALAHLAVGDVSCVERHVDACVRAARAARDPLRALKARLVGAENVRRAGGASAASRVLTHVKRLASSDLPPIVRARCALIRDLVACQGSEVVQRHVAASGLPALALFAPLPPSRLSSDVSVDDLIEVLRGCQLADDDGAALRQASTTIRARLQAAAVAVFVREGSVPVPIVCDGRSIDPDIAARVIAAGQTIAPHGSGDRLAGGSAVRYGGQTLGAVVARWTFGTSLDTARVSALMTVSATAIAPAVAAALARRAQPIEIRDALARELLGISPAMASVRAAVERAALAPYPVLVEGESGSGKELVARGVHRRSSRRDRPFCTLNCAALPDDLVESELFGHARGAFTGALAERAGVFEEAHSGTLFLDEIGELSPRAQAKVLRTIQEGELRRVGENLSRHVDVRIVAATNRKLEDETAAGRFRMDLFYRLDVIRIHVPPLRDRPEDIAVLTEHFWHEAARRVGSHAALSVATVAALARYKWPGNVRELQNVLAALAVRSPRRGVIHPAALPPVFGQATLGEATRLDEARRTFEAQFVRAALVRTGGHRGQAAEELGLTRQGLAKLMARLGIGE
jgi:DNA-binding NtrC family response regulator